MNRIRSVLAIFCVAVSAGSFVLGFKHSRPNQLDIEPFGHDFGEVRPGESLAADFALINPTRRFISIERTLSSCGCAVGSDLSGKVIAPGEQVRLFVNWKARAEQSRPSVGVVVEYRFVDSLQNNASELLHRAFRLTASVQRDKKK